MQLQYIGARYVPVWYHNSVDETSNWEINVEYEPLTFVTTLNNHLYLSKKTVPDNIGTPADNTDYWLDMGVFTGQSTEELQHEIDQINLDLDDVKEDVERLKNHNFLFVSDSYGARTFNSKTLIELIAERIGITSSQYENVQINGSGFIGLGEGRPTFLEAVQQHTFTIEDDDITDIIVMGGANDLLETEGDLLTAISQFCLYCKNRFKNADIRVGHTGRYWNKTYLDDIHNNSLPAWRKCIRYGASYIANSEYILHRRDLVESDGVHPTADGVNEIAGQIASAIISGGGCDVHYECYADLAVSAGQYYDVVSISDPQKIRISLDNDIVTVSFPETAILNIYRSNPQTQPQTYIISDVVTIDQGNNKVAMFGNYANNVPKGAKFAGILRSGSGLANEGMISTSLYFGSDDRVHVCVYLYTKGGSWASISVGGVQILLQAQSLTIPSDCC